MLDFGLGNYNSSLITQATWLHTDDYIHTAMHFCFSSQKTLEVLNLKIEILGFVVNRKRKSYLFLKALSPNWRLSLNLTFI